MKKLIFLLWIWGGCIGGWSQEVAWNNFYDALTRLYRENGPLAGSNIYGQLVAGFERDDLQPLGSPKTHVQGKVSDSGTAVPWAEFGQKVWVQLVVWDGDLWGAILEKVPEDQVGRTEAIQVILSWHPRGYPALAYFKQSAIVPGPSAGLPLTAVQPYAQTWADFYSSTVLAQTFRAFYSGHLSHLTLDLFRGSTDPLPVKVEIYRTENGVPAGPALGSALLERVNYSLENKISFPAKSIWVETGQLYAMVLSTSTPQSSTQFRIAISVQEEFSEGELLLKDNSGNWQPHPLENSKGAALKFALRVHADFPPLRFVRPAPDERITAQGDVVLSAGVAEGWREEEIVQVDFFAIGALLGSAQGSPYEMIWTNVPPGRHLLQAKATTVEGQELISWTHPVRVRPAHDDWTDAAPLSGRQVQVETSNRGATTGDLEMFWRGRHGGPAVFYSWTAPDSGTVFISEQGSSLRHAFQIYAQSPSSAMGFLTHNLPVSGSSENVTIFAGVGGGNPKPFFAEAGWRYFIAVGGILGEEGDLSFRLWQPPVNDSFLHPIVLRGAELQVEGDNTAATPDLVEPPHPVELEGKSVWFSWTAPASGELEVAISEESLPIAVRVYTGSSFDLRLVAGNLAENPARKAFKFTVTEGETYAISVDTFPGSQGAFAFSMKLNAVEWAHPPDFARFAEVAEFPLVIVPPSHAPAVREVLFFAGKQLLGVSEAWPYRISARLDAPGQYSLRAVVVYADGSEQISAPRTVRLAESLAPRRPFLSAGTDRSSAVDVHGNLYAWGVGVASRRSHPQKNAPPPDAAGWLGAWQWERRIFGLSENHELHEQFRGAVAKPQGLEGWFSLLATDRLMGLGTDHQVYLDFRQRLPTPDGVSGWVSASGRTSFGRLLALSLSGELYFWENVSPNVLPQLWPLPKLNRRVAQLETIGLSSHLFLSLDGKVYHADGRLAFPEELGAVNLITGGGSHYLALGAQGRLYGSGWNGWQQVGSLALDQTISDVRSVESPAGVEGWLLAAAGGEYSLALAQDGRVYGWGNNSQFQVGPIPAALAPTPALVANLPNLYGENPIRLASPPNGLMGYIGQTVVMRPNQDSMTPDGVRVFYFAGTKLLGSGEAPDFSLEWKPVETGAWQISAVVMNDYGALRDTTASWIRFDHPQVELSPVSQEGERAGHERQTAKILNGSFAPLDRWRLEISNLPDGVQVANGFMQSPNQFVVELPGPVEPGTMAEVEIVYYNPRSKHLGEVIIEVKPDADWPPPEQEGEIEILWVIALPNGAFELEFLAATSFTCQIERSLDLENWENISEEFKGEGRPMRRQIHPSSEDKPAKAFFRLRAW